MVMCLTKRICISAIPLTVSTNVLAGVIVLTDGANNAGIDPAAAVAALGKAGVPVFPLGIGSDRLPANVRVADVLVHVEPAGVLEETSGEGDHG